MQTLLFLLVLGFGATRVDSAIHIGSSVMRHMWISPIQVFQLSSQDFTTGDSEFLKLEIFLEQLSRSVLDKFSRFQKNQSLADQYRSSFDIHPDASISDVFFYHQQDSSKFIQRDLSGASAEYCSEMKKYDSTIFQVINDAVSKFSSELGISINGDRHLQRKDVLVWTSVHPPGVHHLAHHHPNSAISGVLYLQTPPGSGSIYFQDPRGGLPPFGKTIRIQPERGTLVLFPGWLVHGVSTNLGTSPRISLSFNTNISWELTSDYNVGYYSQYAQGDQEL